MACALPAPAEKRIALVVGNSAYKNVTALDNPSKDAALMADTLRELGFTLVGGSRPARSRQGAIRQRGAGFRHGSCQGADVALFYYAGHGVQVRGANYLVPVGANPTREADVDFQMVDVNLVLRQMEGAGTRLNLVILDACRNNPFGGAGLRASDGGLAQMRAPEGTLISYATQPGNVAQDGSDGHSPYTKALAADDPERRASTCSRPSTRSGCGEARHRGAQQPWVSSSPIDGTFYFVPPTQSAPPQVAAMQPDPLPDRLRADPDRVPLRDAALLSELSERLYELNFDPDSAEGPMA